MGAWGHRSFDNDGAHDWLRDLESGGIAKLRGAMTRVTKRTLKQYVDVDDASAAIAAAEIVAAARGHAMKGLPDGATDWLGAHAAKVTAADAQLAAKAVTRVVRSSELQELWADHGAKNPWTRDIAKLLERLAKKPATRTANTRTAAKRRPRPRVAMPELEYRYAKSPDGTLTASNGCSSGMCTVVIEGNGGGGSVFAATCDLDAIGMRWINDAVFEVTYPATIQVLKRDASWFLFGRTVKCRYKTT